MKKRYAFFDGKGLRVDEDEDEEDEEDASKAGSSEAESEDDSFLFAFVGLVLPDVSAVAGAGAVAVAGAGAARLALTAVLAVECSCCRLRSSSCCWVIEGRRFRKLKSSAIISAINAADAASASIGRLSDIVCGEGGGGVLQSAVCRV